MVDNEAGPHKNHTVVFLGSEKGIILKFLAKMDNGFLNDSLFLEELNVYNPDKYVALAVHLYVLVRWIEIQKRMDTVATNKGRSVIACVCYRKRVCV